MPKVVTSINQSLPFAGVASWRRRKSAVVVPIAVTLPPPCGGGGDDPPALPPIISVNTNTAHDPGGWTVPDKVTTKKEPDCRSDAGKERTSKRQKQVFLKKRSFPLGDTLEKRRGSEASTCL
jgi:hypothetical protein